MGIFPELKETRVFPNKSSVMEHSEFITEYFTEEVESGRMSGPYSREGMEAVLGGPFQCSPLAVDEKEVDGSFELKLRMCSNLSKGDARTPSVNSFSSKDEFPTNYDPAALVGELVSLNSLVANPHLACFYPSQSQFSIIVGRHTPPHFFLTRSHAVIILPSHCASARVGYDTQ